MDQTSPCLASKETSSARQVAMVLAEETCRNPEPGPGDCPTLSPTIPHPPPPSPPPTCLTSSSPHRPTRALRSSSTLSLTLPRSKLKSFGDRAFSPHSTPTLELSPPTCPRLTLTPHIQIPFCTDIELEFQSKEVNSVIPEDEPAWWVILDLKDILELVVDPIQTDEMIAGQNL
ncbi:hypothetical protein N1851_018767 [Merluccius polli]|uniref:Uncharacterized protein n=1 Tax=Merluccius polli TaxID=89951 RepID=A0AA47P126_MERPO|nr:hypothetical protein N1851_018767 [Merluccius polli]